MFTGLSDTEPITVRRVMLQVWAAALFAMYSGFQLSLAILRREIEGAIVGLGWAAVSIMWGVRTHRMVERLVSSQADTTRELDAR